MSINRGMNKDVLHIYIMGYYSVIENNEVMPFVATQMDLDIIMPREASQRENDKYHTISLVSGI